MEEPAHTQHVLASHCLHVTPKAPHAKGHKQYDSTAGEPQGGKMKPLPLDVKAAVLSVGAQRGPVLRRSKEVTV